MTEVQSYMEKVNIKTSALKQLVKESTKTKTEIKALTRELRKQLVKESTKTKTEIKALTRELSNLVGTLSKKVDALKACQLALSAKSMDNLVGTLSKKVDALKACQLALSAKSMEHEKQAAMERAPRDGPQKTKECSSRGVQADEQEILRETGEREKNLAKEVLRALQGDGGWEAL
ncbi:hypothetical protein QE152_g41574, partial [Popillia japonica]